MLNRRITAIFALIALLLLAGTAMAQSMKKYVVLPFQYNGPQKYAYFPKAFQASLNSNLEWAGHVEPAADSVAEKIKAPKNQTDAIGILKKNGLDYLITGSVAILNDEATLAINAFDKDGKTYKKKGQTDVDEIVPWLDEQSRTIMGDIFNRPGYSTAEQKTNPEANSPLASQESPINSQFIPADGDQYTAASLNPQFRYEGGAETEGRWRSQTLRFFSTSMAIGDGNGDGKNEIFILTKTGISAYTYDSGKLRHLDTMTMTPNTKFMRVELIDLDQDGASEVIVGTYQETKRNELLAPEGTVRSHILSFSDNKFKYLLASFRKFLGVLRTPPTYSPILVTQAKGDGRFFAKHLNEAYFKNGELITGPRIAAPEYGNIYNMTYLPDGEGYKYAVLDNFHRLKMYDQTMEKLSSSGDDRYNSSGVGIETSERLAGMGAGTSTDAKIATYNVPFHMVAAKLGKSKKYELLVNKDLSIAAQFFSRFTYYSQGEIHALAWDGVGMNLAWKTRRIKGQVADIALADLNNDGRKQLVVLLNTFPGGLGFSNRKTVVLAYDLNM